MIVDQKGAPSKPESSKCYVNVAVQGGFKTLMGVARMLGTNKILNRHKFGKRFRIKYLFIPTHSISKNCSYDIVQLGQLINAYKGD